MDSIQKSHRIRIVAPILNKIVQNTKSSINPPSNFSYHSTYKSIQGSPTRLILRGYNKQKKEENSVLIQETPIESSARSRSLTRNHESDTPTTLRNNDSQNQNYSNLSKLPKTPEKVLKKPRFSVSPERIICTGKKTGKILIVSPIYVGGTYVVLFNYPPQCRKESRINDRVQGSDDFKLFYHVSSFVHTYNSVINSLSFAGFEPNASKYTILISGVPKIELIREFNPYQKINHFPASKQLGRKDNL